jgi:hypothetical protein
MVMGQPLQKLHGQNCARFLLSCGHVVLQETPTLRKHILPSRLNDYTLELILKTEYLGQYVDINLRYPRTCLHAVKTQTVRMCLWNVLPFGLVEIYQNLGETCCIQFQCRNTWYFLQK